MNRMKKYYKSMWIIKVVHKKMEAREMQVIIE